MTTSCVPAVKDAVLDLLAPALPGVQVTYGHPGRNMQRELVFLGGAETDQEWAHLGARARTETFDIDLIVNVRRPGAQQRAVTERAYEILATVEDVLRANVRLDGLVTQIGVRPRTLLELFTDDGREAQITALLSGDARI